MARWTLVTFRRRGQLRDKWFQMVQTYVMEIHIHYLRPYWTKELWSSTEEFHAGADGVFLCVMIVGMGLNLQWSITFKPWRWHPWVRHRNSVAGWRHDMEPFSTLLTLCEGNPPVTGGFPHKGPTVRSFDGLFYDSLNTCLTNSWVAGVMQRFDVPFDVSLNNC